MLLRLLPFCKDIVCVMGMVISIIGGVVIADDRRRAIHKYHMVKPNPRFSNKFRRISAANIEGTHKNPPTQTHAQNRMYPLSVCECVCMCTYIYIYIMLCTYTSSALASVATARERASSAINHAVLRAGAVCRRCCRRREMCETARGSRGAAMASPRW